MTNFFIAISQLKDAGYSFSRTISGSCVSNSIPVSGEFTVLYVKYRYTPITYF